MQAAGLQRWARLLASAEFSLLHVEGTTKLQNTALEKGCKSRSRNNFVTLFPAPAQDTHQRPVLSLPSARKIDHRYGGNPLEISLSAHMANGGSVTSARSYPRPPANDK